MLYRMLERWGGAVHRFRWAIIVTWAIAIAAAGTLSIRYSDVLSGGGWDIPHSDSLKVKHTLSEQFDGRSATSLILVYRDGAHAADTREFADGLRSAVEFVGKEEGVVGTYSLLDAADALKPGMIGKDGHTTYAFVNMDIEEDYAINRMPDVQQQLGAFARDRGVETYLIGASALWGDAAVYSQEGLAKAEMIVFPLVFLILMLVFRSLMATITPIIVTVAAVVAGLGVIYYIGSHIEISVFVTNSALMLGMGVGIDYSLFMVNRFRLELDAGRDVNRAMAIAMRTSGHTVLFSGITVLAAMTALFVVELPAVKAIAFGAVTVVIFAVLATLSLLPAVLVMLEKRINKGRIHLPAMFGRRATGRESLWRRLAAAMMRRPVVFLGVSIVVMGFFTLPIGGMKLNTNEVDILPAVSPARIGFEMYERAFGTEGTSTNTLIVRSVASEEGNADAPADSGASSGSDSVKTEDASSGSNVTKSLRPETLAYFMKLQAELSELDGVKRATSVLSFLPGMEPAQAAALLSGDPSGWPAGLRPMIDRYVSRDGQTLVMDIQFASEGASAESMRLAERIRDEIVPASEPPASLSITLGGETVQAMEMNGAIYDAFIPTLLIMLGLIYFILLITFRSVLLPLKAILMNLLSVGATFGIVTWVFADGHGIELFGAVASGYISNFIPLLMLALLFGLSTDYEVFLVSRIKEHYEESGDNEESVAVGLEATGPLITGAAFLMIAVFTGFAFSSMLPIQTLGFGMAVAILLDASLVRMIIVPAAMKLLGNWNWWLPGTRHRSRG